MKIRVAEVGPGEYEVAFRVHGDGKTAQGVVESFFLAALNDQVKFGILR